MARAKKTDEVQQAITQSVRSDIKDTREIGGGPLLFTLAGGGGTVAPWWSQRRDVDLRALLKKSDHLSGAMYNFCTKIATIPLQIVAKDRSIQQHVMLAEQYEEHIKTYSEFGFGWGQFVTKWVEEYHSQDNGVFVEFIAEGASDTPVEGVVYSMNILDSARCIRTSNPEFPVIYQDISGKRYKLHRTRVAAISQSPSPKQEMNNVGFCAISRCVSSAQNLIDISVYKQERLGSRPSQGILLTGGGLDPEDLELAFTSQALSDDESGLTRYSTWTALGNKNVVAPTLQNIRLNDAPEWFDEQESTTLGVAVIAMAFGVDARELFPSLEGTSSKADAIITHIKQRGKGPGHVISTLEHMLNTKVLPPFLTAVFDYQDDSQDRQEAEISSVRSYTRVRNMQSGTTNPRVERQLMLERGELSDAQYEELELADGRLPDGNSVEVLFYTEDTQYKEWLGDVNESNAEEKRIEIMKFLMGTRAAEAIRKARRAIAAIEYMYPPEDPFETEDGKEPRDGNNNGYIYDGTQRERAVSKPNSRRGKKGPSDRESAMPDQTYQGGEKYDEKLPRQTVNAPDETQNYQER